MSKEKLQQELDSLLDAFDNAGLEASEEDATKSESADEGTETDAADETLEEEELEASEGEEESGEESDEEEEESGESSEDELTRVKAELEELKKKVEKPAEEESTSTKLPNPKPEVQEIDVFGGKEFEDIIESKEAFSEWATALVNKVQEVTQESIYRNIPQVIQSYTDQQLEVKSRADKFYASHPDLADHKAEVAKSANLIAQAEPGLDYDAFFDKVAKHARYMLGLNTENMTDDGKGGKEKKKPALAKKSAKSNSRSAHKQPELTGMEKEISEMLKQIE